MIDGEWRATRMQPCPTGAANEVTVQTTNFSDGPHALQRCATDFAGNSACLFPTTVLIDNHPPASPRKLSLAGGEGWRHLDNFDFSWQNPDQGPASPIGGAYWRITGPGGYDTGVNLAAAHDISSLADRTLPRPGVYAFHSGCATRPAMPIPARRLKCRCGSTTCRPGWPSKPRPTLPGLICRPQSARR